jgi:exodeoxyribonuclease VII large subunit
MMEAISLYELNNRIKQTLKASFADSVWITAEITEVQLNRSGHCYLQLADKREQEDSIVATARGTIWAFTFRTLRPYFETTTGRQLEKGMKVLLNVEVVFHDLYHRGSGTEKERNPGSARGRRGNRYEPGTGIPGIA